MKNKNMEYEDLTAKIIGCAYRVYNKMGFGFLESVYEKCLLIELNKVGLKYNDQFAINVYYDTENVDKFIVDILVENTIIVELKSVRQIIKAHEIQLVNYLVATRKDVGLLINFGETKVEVTRKVRQLSNN